MSYALKPEVLDAARVAFGASSDGQLAAHLGVTAGTVSNYRAGRTLPSIATTMKLRMATGIQIEKMLTTINVDAA